MRRELFGNLLVLTFVRRNSLRHMAASTKQQLKIDITSDNICPWCYVGKRRLEKALSQIDPSRVNVSVSWFPYELDHGLPRDGSLLKMDRYKQKFGEARVKQMLPQMTETGKQEGINFSYGGKIGSTFDSHRLLYYVKRQENGEQKQNDLINALFRAYFEEEQDLADHRVLIKAAEQAGLNGSEVERFLQSDQYKKEVQEEIEQSQSEGISGVPHFRINGRVELSGAQDPQQFLQAFRKAGVNL